MSAPFRCWKGPTRIAHLHSGAAPTAPRSHKPTGVRPDLLLVVGLPSADVSPQDRRGSHVVTAGSRGFLWGSLGSWTHGPARTNGPMLRRVRQRLMVAFEKPSSDLGPHKGGSHRAKGRRSEGHYSRVPSRLSVLVPPKGHFARFHACIQTLPPTLPVLSGEPGVSRGRILPCLPCLPPRAISE